MTTFRVIEQHDGRYIVVAIYGDNSYTTRKGETIVEYENDVRSLRECFGAIADYVCESGQMYDHDTVVQFVRYPA